METILGLLGVAAYIVGVLALAAGVTFVVIRLSPAKDRPKEAKS
jgi:hypothetical protein